MFKLQQSSIQVLTGSTGIKISIVLIFPGPNFLQLEHKLHRQGTWCFELLTQIKTQGDLAVGPTHETTNQMVLTSMLMAMISTVCWWHCSVCWWHCSVCWWQCWVCRWQCSVCWHLEPWCACCAPGGRWPPAPGLPAPGPAWTGRWSVAQRCWPRLQSEKTTMLITLS